ncbi:signal peptidase II [Faecalibacterium gallinarum]|mgnify:CR=1 FL=1|uniref:Lipoprotein signal peptidase n=1 Tax=Faecalibacterium gallinarum TaxID=2903556 RepID=A0AA37IXA0_9FIRM|nr:signal peptidase II [Faecalibacterium gallinarum]GJN64053.1 lipoprotein signal peptidase [Faecalibacterium gallinarum]
MQYILINLICVAALLGMDQAIKYWAVEVLQPVGSMPLIPHVVELRFTYNQGMAFSMLSGKQLLLVVVTGILLIGVAYWLFFRSRENLLTRVSLILVLGGGLGNFIDRVLNGQVVDYINLLFMRFAIFNFADICLCVGAGLWALSIFLEECHNGPEKTQKEN